MHKDLQQLKSDLERGKKKDQVKDIKKALKDFRYLGKSERRLNHNEKVVEDFLDELKKKVAGAEQLHDQLYAEAANLIKTTSFYEGKIRDYLFCLKEEVKEHEIEKAHAALMELFQIIEDTEKWLAALSADLANAQKLGREFYEVHGMSIGKILDEMKSKSVFDPETAKRLEVAILQSDENAEALQHYEKRWDELFFERYTHYDFPEEIYHSIVSAFIIRIILQCLPWQIIPKSRGKAGHGNGVLEYYALPQDDPRTLIVDIFWQNVGYFGDLIDLAETMKERWTAVPEDEHVDITKICPEKSNCTALLVILLRLRERGYNAKIIRFLITEFANYMSSDYPKKNIITHNKILTIILKTSLLTGISVAELGGGWYTTNFYSLMKYDHEGKDVGAWFTYKKDWNTKLWGEYIRHEPQGHQTVHDHERVTLESYKKFFPKKVDFSLSSRVISLGSGMEYGNHSSKYCAFELFACFANITKKDGYSIQYADTVGRCMEYAPFLDLVGLKLVEIHGGNIFVYQKINNDRISKKEFDRWYNKNISELRKLFGEA